MQKLNIFTNRPAGGNALLSQFITKVGDGARSSGSRFISENAVRAGLGMEGYDVAQFEGDINAGSENLQRLIDNTRKTLKMPSLGLAQESAAVIGGLIAGNARAVLARSLNTPNTLAQEAARYRNCRVVNVPGAIASLHDRPQNLSMEAYDEKANGNVVAYSVAYNADASRQDDFGEQHYPTVTCDQNSLGFTMSIQLHLIQEEVRRTLDGNVNDFGRQNIIRAAVDPDLLRNDQTEIVPVYRDDGSEHDTTHHFAPASDVAPIVRKIDRHDVKTSALKFGAKFDPLGLCQSEALMNAGVMDQTDAIDPAIVMSELYIKLGAAGGNAVLKYNTANLPLTQFNAAPQGNGRQMTLNFTTEHLRVTSQTKKLDGTPITQLVTALDGYTVRLATSAFGNLLLDRGDTQLNAGPVTVHSITSNSGVQISTKDGAGKAIADLFIGATSAYFSLRMYRTNSNKLNRGQMIDDQTYHQLYAVPTLPPITALRPVGETEANDGERVQALIVTTKMRSSNLAVERHLAYLGTLKEIYNEHDSHLSQPDTLGMARFLVNVAYEEHVGANAVDVADVINSLESKDHAENVRSVLTNLIQDMTARLYFKSALLVARQMTLGTGQTKPLVILGTDPYIANYLYVQGDTRTMGDMFDFKVVATMNKNMNGKITVAFGDSSALNSGVPNMLHWGSMLWRPEITAIMPVSRNGRLSNEVTVTPSLLHINHLPIGGIIEVKNIHLAMANSNDIKVIMTPATP